MTNLFCHATRRRPTPVVMTKYTYCRITACIHHQAANQAPTPRPPPQSETDPLSNLQADLRRGWNEIVASTTKLKDNNEILGLIWSVMTEGVNHRGKTTVARQLAYRSRRSQDI